ncbi:hypothetical protein R3P38DRAFT_3043280 [Favolaschia claudopus]|uniref:Dynamin N-terminal domain-containing protein n=1 Tax=Favolaschia claudopus TaxID=2862362 RepID=A0AAW0A9D1_9AGAR
MSSSRSSSPLSSIASINDEVNESVEDTELKQAFHLVSDVVERLKIVENVAPERQHDMHDTIQLLGDGALQANHKVAVSGKSTLLNAVLGCSLLSVSDMGAACTSVVTEVSYGAGPHVLATVVYKTRQQWELDLKLLLADVQDAGDSADNDVLYARQNLRQVETVDWCAPSLLGTLLDDEAVKSKLDTTTTVSSDAKEMGQQLQLLWQDYLWPLVEIVKINGPFPVLRTGITLVDLPGHGDADVVRNQVADRYMQDANTVLLVSAVQRAIDDDGIQGYLKKYLSQMIVDGRFRENSVVLVLTQNDVVGNNDFITSNKDEEIKKNQGAIQKLEKQIQRRNERQDPKVPQLRERLSSLQAARKALVFERQGDLAERRTVSVTKALQQKCQALYAEISQLPGARDSPCVPIFCVGSSDYLFFLGLQNNQVESRVFSSKDATRIPELHDHLVRVGGQHTVQRAIDLLSLTYRLLTRGPSVPEGQTRYQQEILDLENFCIGRVHSLVDSVNDVLTKILGEANAAIDEARGQSPYVFQTIAQQCKWNQYLALMRRHGEFGSINLNVRLTAAVAESASLRTRWHSGFNEEIPALMSECAKDLQTRVLLTVRKLAEKVQKPLDKFSQSLDTSVERLFTRVETLVTVQQRQSSRIWAPAIKRALAPQYASVADTSPGHKRFDRMKANEVFLEQSAQTIFQTLKTDIQTSFASCIHLARSELLVGLHQTLPDVPLFLTGEPNLDGPSVFARILEEKEEMIFETMDILKARVTVQ